MNAPLPTAAREALRFAIAPCSLGQVLVATDASGVRAILLGDSAQALASDLQARWPSAQLFADAGGLARPLRDAVALVESPQRGFDHALHLQGTDFQQRVWHALRAVPAGETVSYAELAQRAGMPGAARAVAAACAANPLAIAVPCHRVVRSDGGLSGYRWGVARKRALLQREASA